jgi:hypothetical protein
MVSDYEVVLTTGSDDVPLEKLRDPVYVYTWHLTVDVDMLCAGYDPNPVSRIAGDVVEFLGLLGGYHYIVLTVNEEYRLVYLFYHLCRPHLAEIRLEENAPCECNNGGEPRGETE